MKKILLISGILAALAAGCSKQTRDSSEETAASAKADIVQTAEDIRDETVKGAKAVAKEAEKLAKDVKDGTVEAARELKKAAVEEKDAIQNSLINN